METMQVMREKVTVHVGGRSQSLGSNRMVLLLPHSGSRGCGEEQSFAIRAWSLPATLRMAGAMINSMDRYGGIAEGAAVSRWSKDWINQLSTTDRARLEQNWVCVYYEGKVLYRTVKQPILDAVEKVALGRSLRAVDFDGSTYEEVARRGDGMDRESVFREAERRRIVKQAGELMSQAAGAEATIEVDGQLAFSLDDSGWGIRVEVFDRNLGDAGQVRFSVTRRGNKRDRWGAPLACLRAASAIVEAAALVGEFHRLVRARRDMAVLEREAAENRLTQIQDRVRDLQGRLELIAEGNGLNMTSERPDYIAELAAARMA